MAKQTHLLVSPSARPHELSPAPGAVAIVQGALTIRTLARVEP